MSPSPAATLRLPRRMLVPGSVLLCLAASSLPATGPEESVPSVVPPVKVEGRVRDRIRRTGVPGATIRADRAGPAVRTDTEGRFSLDLPSSGWCRLEVEADGYRSFATRVFITGPHEARSYVTLDLERREASDRPVDRAPRPDRTAPPAPIEPRPHPGGSPLARGAKRTRLTARQRPASAPRPNRITGRLIVDPAVGVPSDLRVVLVEVSSDDRRRPALRGRVLASARPVGERFSLAVPSRSATASLEARVGSFRVATGGVYSLSPGERVRDAVLVLGARYLFRGRVVGARAEPLAGAIVRGHSLGAEPPFFFETRTDGSGGFLLGAEEPVSVRFEVAHRAYETARVTAGIGLEPSPGEDVGRTTVMLRAGSRSPAAAPGR